MKIERNLLIELLSNFQKNYIKKIESKVTGLRNTHHWNFFFEILLNMLTFYVVKFSVNVPERIKNRYS